ncbi:phosphatidylinositol binding [Desmophyllum pertusum]|uniref:Phosphatidylinositol binding n=1 Tax=Desmophyllum pertusum TaxID=174260 RepID=A0A9X0CGS3_9CNID|nr:phosphatidylinositol binding [Desmophyllum pertusum]
MTITPKKNSEIVKVDVNNPKLHNCSGNKFVDYEIAIETSNKAFFRKCSSVRRRYSDFCWLRSKLSSTEINGFGRERGIPCLPPKSYFSRFNKEVIDSRQEGLQDFLKEIVKVNDFLSFAGLHLFLQTQLPIQEINGFLEGKYGENASIEELIRSQELAKSSEEDKILHVQCSSEDCTLLSSSNWDITCTTTPTTADNISTNSETDEVTSEQHLSDSYSSSLGYLSSSAEKSTFMYTMYR